MAKYGAKAQETVKEAMHKYKRGKLKSGRSGKTVQSKKQAIAIGLSEAREKGAKVPSVKKRTPKKRPARSTKPKATTSKKRVRKTSSKARAKK